MDISNDIICLFSEQLKDQDGSYVIEVPKREVDLGMLQHGEVYRVAVLSGSDKSKSDESKSARSQESARKTPDQPVADGEERTVDIEDIGEQGDGIARVERGFIVIVPDTEKGERVTIKITDVRENVAFAEVIEREDYVE